MANFDNASYKDTHYFKDDFRSTGKDNPSIEGIPKINSTIKENPYRSNVEIEGGEIVLQPDMSALFKAKGKRHSQGGMDVLLKPDSFIFSDFKDIKITDKDKEMFELKKGGAITPAKVVKENVDPKHYNNLINNISDPFKDELARKSSSMMLEKYITTLGSIAFLQESKKNFPEGIPPFSMGSAPVFDAGKKDDIDESKQYKKYGGNVQMQAAGIVPDPNRRHPKSAGWYYDNQTSSWKKRDMSQFLPRGGKNYGTTDPFAVVTPQGGSSGNPEQANNWGLWQGDKLDVFQKTNNVNFSNAADKIGDLTQLAKRLGYTGPRDNKAFQQWLYNSSPENKAVIDKWHNTYNQGPTKGMFDGKIGIRWQNAMKELSIPPAETEPPKTPELAKRLTPDINYGPTPNDVIGGAQGVKRADWEFTPWQKLSQMYNWGRYAGVRRYMPYRSRYTATYAEPSLLNPEQTVGDVKGMFNQQLKGLDTLNPIMRQAAAQQSYGQALNTIPGIRSQYDNQNAQISNNFRQYNNQVRNNESLTNMMNDQKYYEQAITARVNFDNMRQFAADQAMSNVLKDAQDNTELSYKLMQQDHPAYGFDFRSGNFYRNPKDIRDVENNPQSDYTQQLLSSIDFASLTNQEKIKLIDSSFKGKALQYLKPHKKGGKIPRNPYK